MIHHLLLLIIVLIGPLIFLSQEASLVDNHRKLSPSMETERRHQIGSAVKYRSKLAPEAAQSAKSFQSMTKQKKKKEEIEPFGVEIENMMKSNPILLKKYPETTLRCELNEGLGYAISYRIDVEVMRLAGSAFGPSEICVYDFQNRCHKKPYLSIVSNASYICTFRMKDIIVTKRGALLEGTSPKRTMYYGHETMVGEKNVQYAPVMSYMFLKGQELAFIDFVNDKGSFNETNSLSGEVVALRSRFDDCFNHQSFQSLPLIALVYEFHPSLFSSVYWHASKHTAALLMLLDIPLEKIIIDRAVRVDKVLLPWVPHWNPLQLPMLYGIAGRIEERITKRLLSMSFTQNDTIGIEQVRVLDHRYQTIGFASNMTLSNDKKYIVYLSRPETIRRGVLNELELLQALADWLSPDYQLLVLPSTKAITKFRTMYMIWQQYARIVSRAKVLAGPHGGAMNNMIWAPRDCELIEFNELPKEDSFLQSHNQVPVRFPFLAGWWAKGGGKYWNIEPSMKHPQNFYEGSMKVSVREWLEVLKQVDNGHLLRKEEIDWNRYPFGKHGCFPNEKRTKFSHC